jgi:CheY-like chemotaxis protein
MLLILHIKDVVESGLEALEMIQKADAANNQYVVIFMDIYMPDMSGLDTAKHIQSQYPYKRPVLIALTAQDGRSLEKDHVLEHFDGYITKPFDFNKLEDIIAPEAQKKEIESDIYSRLGARFSQYLKENSSGEDGWRFGPSVDIYPIPGMYAARIQFKIPDQTAQSFEERFAEFKSDPFVLENKLHLSWEVVNLHARIIVQGPYAGSMDDVEYANIPIVAERIYNAMTNQG